MKESINEVIVVIDPCYIHISITPFCLKIKQAVNNKADKFKYLKK